MAGLMRFLRRRKTAPTAPTAPTQSTETPVATVTQAPEEDDDAQHDPPPYSGPPPSQPDQSVTPETPNQAVIPQETAQQMLLDPSLDFTAAQMEQQWRAKDRIFARAVVQFIAERFDGNLKSWAGHKYTYINENENPPRKESAWDDILGYNAWTYRGRFRQVSFLAKRDFERRGFEVRKCEVYSSTDGIYVQWSLDLRRSTK